MNKPILDVICEKANVDFKDNHDLWLNNGYALRKTVGILGLLLPFLLFGFLWLETGFAEPLSSISHYYFTRVSGIFVAILSVLAIFLLIYKGHKPIDFVMSSIAGIAALVVAFIPTNNIVDNCCSNTNVAAVTFLPISPMRSMVHNIAAALFLGSLAYMCLFLFTKSDKSSKGMGKMKQIRNRIYIFCGVVMLASLLFIFLAGFLSWMDPITYNKFELTYWLETLAIICFGLSWLIKGNTFFKDKD